MPNLRNESRKDWSARDEPATEGELKLGALQRIADAVERSAAAAERSATAVEKVVASYDALRQDRDWYKRRSEEEQASRRHAERRIASLRGVITRLRRWSA